MPRPLNAALSLALALALATLASAGPKRVVPSLLVHARYVCLGYDVGSGFLSDEQAISSPETVFPEDRRALEAIRQEIERWGKYVVALRPEQADLLIAVRTGRRLGASIGIGIGGGDGRGGLGGRQQQSGFVGGEISSPDDLFVVYEARGGRPGAPLWRRQGRDALSGAPPRAFEAFRADVEKMPPPTPEPAAPQK